MKKLYNLGIDEDKKVYYYLKYHIIESKNIMD